jgi:queuine tRNA-ribosyltransferase
MISDSGGFQVMSIAKRYSGNAAITDEGVVFEMDRVKHKFTPEDSIKFQLQMKTDLMVVLDDFTPPNATYEEAKETVERTTLWARRCRATYDSE